MTKRGKENENYPVTPLRKFRILTEMLLILFPDAVVGDGTCSGEILFHDGTAVSRHPFY
jgi:hypothetical protein